MISNMNKDYFSFFEYYKELFSMVDCFHFNSSITSDIYRKNLNIIKGEIRLISHADIRDKRRKKKFNPSLLQLGFIGNTSVYKGFPLLEQILNEIDKEKVDCWRLSVWGRRESSVHHPNIVFKGQYQTSQLKDVFSEMDLLVVPSIWNETFSLIALEALSFGVPVLLSSTVGAKDIIQRYAPSFIFHTGQELKDKIMSLMVDRTPLIVFNTNILNMPWVYSFQEHLNAIDQLYKNI
jgi:glycosyltransferase involved in cell wall biosynthesis